MLAVSGRIRVNANHHEDYPVFRMKLMCGSTPTSLGQYHSVVSVSPTDSLTRKPSPNANSRLAAARAMLVKTKR